MELREQEGKRPPGAWEHRFTESQRLGILGLWNPRFLESLELKGFNTDQAPSSSHVPTPTTAPSARPPTALVLTSLGRGVEPRAARTPWALPAYLPLPAPARRCAANRLRLSSRWGVASQHKSLLHLSRGSEDTARPTGSQAIMGINIDADGRARRLQRELTQTPPTPGLHQTTPRGRLFPVALF